MRDTRPVNLRLTTIHFPIPAIISILHRISGILVFLFIPFLLFVLGKSLASAEGFASLQQCLRCGLVRFLVWLFLAAFIYHFVAGIRHLLMDIGIGEELKSGRRGAWIVIVLSLILIVIAGIYLWPSV